MNREHRWKSALHESGHGIAAIALGGKCLGLVLLDDGYSGLCQSGDLDATRTAFMVAAGPAAERLAEVVPVPDVPISESVVATDEVESLAVFTSSPLLACQMARTPETRKHFSSDDRQLALWAVTGHEDEPERWAARRYFADHVAEHVVAKNAAAIVRVATALFEKSSLSETEIKKLVDGAKS
jgi:hypothetical protein